MNIESFTYGFIFGFAIVFGLLNFISWTKKQKRNAAARATREANKKAEILSRLGHYES